MLKLLVGNLIIDTDLSESFQTVCFYFSDDLLGLHLNAVPLEPVAPKTCNKDERH